VDLDGTRPGSGPGGHDRLDVNGPVDLGGAALGIRAGFTPVLNDEFVIIDNDGTDPVTGAFAGLPEGSLVPGGIAGRVARLTYKGGDGNDVVLRVDPLVTLHLADSASVESGAPGAVTTILVGTILDPGSLDTFTLQVDWGDPLSPANKETITLAAGATGFTLPHQYIDDNPSATSSDVYTMGLTLTDADFGSMSTALPVTVLNAAPRVDELLLSAPVIDENGILTVSGTFTDAGSLDTHSVRVNWGDGQSAAAAVDQAARTFTAVHQYPDNDRTLTPADTFTLSVTVTDDDGGQAEVQAAVMVNNVAPAITALSNSSAPDAQTRLGAPVTLTGTFSDPGADAHEILIDWGDGDSLETIPIAAGARTFSVDHVYENPTANQIVVTLRDDDGGSDTGTSEVYLAGAGVSDGVLYLSGTELGATARITFYADQGLIEVFTDFPAGPTTRTFDAADVQKMAINLRGGGAPVLIEEKEGDLALDVITDTNLNIEAAGSLDLRRIRFAPLPAAGGGVVNVATGGDVILDQVDLGSGGVFAATAGGSIREAEPGDPEVDLVAATVDLFAAHGIGGASDGDLALETQVALLTAEVRSGAVHLNNAGEIEIGSLTVPAGDVGLAAGGDILISGRVNTGATGSVDLEAAGQVYMQGGERLATGALAVRAQTGIFLRTAVADLDAHVLGQGIMEIHETDAIELQDVTNADGPIRLIAGGTVTAGRVASLTDAEGNNAGLISLGGDILVDDIGVGREHGQISLSSARDIREVDDTDAAVDLKGALGILYAQGRIDKDLERSFRSLPQQGKGKKAKHGQKEALYEFESGRKLKLKNIRGDVELFFSLADKVDVSATGDIHVTYLDSHGHDIDLESKSGGIHVETINSGTRKGDIKLKADKFVLLAGRLYSGDMGQIKAGDDLEISAEDDIRIYGSIDTADDIKIDSDDADVLIEGMVTAGDDIDIKADGNILLSATMEAGDDLDLQAGRNLRSTTAAIISQGDVEIKAKEDIFIDAAITAAGEIEIESDSSLTTAAGAVLTAGDDIELKAQEDLSVEAALIAGDDVKLDSRSDVRIAGNVRAEDEVKIKARGDVEVAAGIEAADRIDLSAKDNLTLLPGSTLSGINGEKVRKVTLRAGGDMMLDGTINAKKRHF